MTEAEIKKLIQRELPRAIAISPTIDDFARAVAEVFSIEIYNYANEVED